MRSDRSRRAISPRRPRRGRRTPRTNRWGERRANNREHAGTGSALGRPARRECRRDPGRGRRAGPDRRRSRGWRLARANFRGRGERLVRSRPDHEHGEHVARTKKMVDVFGDITTELNAEARLGPIPRQMKLFAGTGRATTRWDADWDFDAEQAFRHSSTWRKERTARSVTSPSRSTISVSHRRGCGPASTGAGCRPSASGTPC